MDWHNMEIDEVFSNIETSKEGLQSGEAQDRLKQYGPNKIEESKGASKLKIFADQFKNPLIYILIIAGIVTFLLEEYIDSGVIFFVVIINALVGFFQEYKAEESAKALKKMLASKATVLRNGKQTEIDSTMLVPGDIVILSQGSKIPADLRLFKAVELSVDESILTGESVAVQKYEAAIKERGIVASDQENMAFMGTNVVSGRGQGVVVETGSKTVMGGIAKDVKDVDASMTPLQAKFHSFAKLVGLMSLAASTLLFFIGIGIGESMTNMFKVAVAVTVATIPEGLPIVVTIAMSVGVSRMSRKNAIIKKLPAVETLGSTTVICSDKTGTLTKNEMTVKKIWAGGKMLSIEGEGYETKGNFWSPEDQMLVAPDGDFEKLLRIGMLCNNSGVQDGGIVGKPTEASVIVAAIKAGLNSERLNEENPRIDEIPFTSERKRQVTLHDTPEGKLVCCLGAPDVILKNCSKILMNSEEVGLRSEELV